MAFRNLIRKIRAKFTRRTSKAKNQTPYYIPPVNEVGSSEYSSSESIQVVPMPEPPTRPANQAQPFESSSHQSLQIGDQGPYPKPPSGQPTRRLPRRHKAGLVECPNLLKTLIETRNDRESYLHRLPREILNMVVKNLPPAAQHSLRISCRRMCYSNLQISDLSKQKDRFKFCELFERDEIALGRLHCAVCKDTDMSNFLPIDRKKEPAHRACQIHKPVLHICECRSLSFYDVQNKMYELQKRQSYGTVEACWESYTWLDRHFFALEDGSTYLYHYIKFKDPTACPTGQPKRPMSRSGYSRPPPVCVQICPHLTFRSPELRPLLCSQFSKYGLSGRCSYCDTVFQFLSKIKGWNEDPRSTPFLAVRRNLGTLQSMMDPKWLSQTSINEMWNPIPEPNGEFSHTVHYLSDIGIPAYWVRFRKTNPPFLDVIPNTLREESNKMGDAYMYTPDRGVHSKPLWIGPEKVAKDVWGEYGPDGFATQYEVFAPHNGNEMSRLVKR
ncbi:hypothetical protein FQN50_000515 [Emmonsiellopsis sp. PD_5]|nr:hypothetical protein FQN50_000515 [Emmonsiellopsis sp. PD_5]